MTIENTRMLYRSLIIADNVDNSEAISLKKDLTCHVTLQDRTLYRDGSWNSLCLPFVMNEEEVVAQLGSSSLMTLGATELIDNAMMLNFEDATTIEAGKPYIIKWDSDAPAMRHIPIINPMDDVIARLDFISEVPTFDKGQASDWIPEELAKRPWLYDKDKWLDDDIIKEAGVDEEYRMVTGEFDALLAQHGYQRDGDFYRVVKPNNYTIALYCHFGLECVLVSHLMNTSPYPIWHHFSAPPTSVTIVRTEERREGTALFRISNFGDTSHLYAGNEEESVSARFCECYMNADERHE